mmetsp:Transcript_27211/g.56689  ORF Transcript_27211/g.56689 Transcript_27211/m.56689 type:complete len:634 (+) Transcript_27211:170-2071(+)
MSDLNTSDQLDQHKKTKKAGRVVYDNPSTAPQESLHWKRIGNHHQTGDAVIQTHEELISAFTSDVNSLKSNNSKENPYLKLAVWSCVIGYCEALVTHKDSRYALFPIPIDSIRRLVDKEFLPLVHHARAELSKNDVKKSAKSQEGESIHRRTVRAVANAIWKRAQNKKSSMQDELHANSLYTCLCGDVDSKSIDCFGSALLVVIGMNIIGFGTSCLTLSEDHAYESHINQEDGGGNHATKNCVDDLSPSKKRATCEVAIPGNTKAAQSKRGKEISCTFEQLKRDNITAEISWLYMAKNPVLCDSPGMAMAAVVSNLNCDIDKQKPGVDGGKPHVVSRPLYQMKRDMLWILHDAGNMAKFPFALIELGECEEHLSSQKGMEWVDASELLRSNGTMVLRNEKLFLDAIFVSREVYDDAQVYPYLYAGHYHKDAGRDDQSQEYRLVESLRLYAEASRVASAYRYDTKDCLQLMKHMTTVASLISRDILRLPKKCGGNGKDCRTWERRENAIAAATWLMGFFDSLLFWEEREQSTFVEILSIQQKNCVSKLFQLFSADIRTLAISKIHSHKETGDNASAITEDKMIYFGNPRSKRLTKDSLLVMALSKGKISVREMEMTLPYTGGGRSSRQRKRLRV